MKRNNNKHIQKLKRASKQYGRALDLFRRHWTTGKGSNKRLLAVLCRTFKKLNQVMTAMGGVPAKYQTHYPGGVKQLIKDILGQLGAYSKDDRAEAIKSAKYADEILIHTQMLFTLGTSRYGKQTVKNTLVEMAQKGELGKIKLKPGEVVRRNGCKGRLKWCLLE